MKVAAALHLDKSRSLQATSANRITLLRDTDHDGKPDVGTVFLSGLNQPFGMLVMGNSFYVANTNGVLRYLPVARGHQNQRRGPKNPEPARRRL